MPQPDLITAIFRKEVLELSAYKVAESAGLIKLDAMENPYHWPESAVQAWLETIKTAEINRYPDPSAHRLCATLKDYARIPNDFDLLLGNGSDEIILLLMMALKPGATVLSPSPGFVMYKQLSRSLGLGYVDIPLVPGTFDLDLQAMLLAIEKHKPALIFLAYPNNPTGNLFDESAIRDIIQAAPGLVVIDEAYAPFTEASFIDSLGQYDNLLVMRTLSKLGLAGLRLGYIVGAPAFIDELNKIRLPYNINTLTQITAEFALIRADVFDRQTQQIRRERSRILETLSSLPPLEVYPSEANFILFRTPTNTANTIYERLKSQGILIKNLSPQGELLQDCLRVTIGTPEENDAFLNALSNCLSELG
ncbi:MAG: histidinol-phosphate transaminase [Methylomicrobium sp.]